MKLSDFSVHRPVTIAMIFGAMVILGIVSYRILPVQLLPDISVPTIGVSVNTPNSSPENTLENYTKPVESVVAELPSVKEIKSYTGTWGSWIQVDFDPGTDIRFATLDLQERLNALQADFDDSRASVQIFPFTTDNFKNFLMEISVEGDTDLQTLERIARDTVAPQLRSVSGIARVETGGLTAPAATVEIDLDQLNAYNINLGTVFSRLQTAQLNENYLGDWGEGSERRFVRLEQEIENLEDLSRLPLDTQGIMRLRDVADIYEGNALKDWQYRSNGRNALGLQVEREEGENLIQTAEALRQRIAELNAEFEGTIALTVQTDAAEMVQNVLDDVSILAFQGAMLALLIPLFFFRSIRVSLVIFISVPISILTVFNLFSLFDMTINIFSVVGLALGVGILVDNSIVVVESILANYYKKKMNPIEAACRGGTEVGRALFASTLTTGAPFVALVFLDGRFKSIIREPALALVFPLIVSLFVALSLSAMLTSLVLISKKKSNKPFQKTTAFGRWSLHRFRRALFLVIRYKGRVLLFILGLLIFTFAEACQSIRQASTDDDTNRNLVRLYLRMPVNTPSVPLAQPIRYVEEKLNGIDDIENFSVWYRQEAANFDIKLLPIDERESGRTDQEFRDYLLDEIGDYPGCTVSFENPDRFNEESAPPVSNQGEVELRASSRDVLYDYAEKMVELLKLDSRLSEVKIDDQEDLILAEIIPNTDAMKMLGINNQQLSQLLGITQSQGTVTSLTIKQGEEEVNVSVVLKDTEAESLREVELLPIGANDGSSRATLGDVSTFNFRNTVTRTRRTNQQASLSVIYQWEDETLNDSIKERVEAVLSALPNPAGVVASFGGTQQEIDERGKDFAFIMLVGFLLIYLVMAGAFESLWVPFTIIVTNPLMAIGIVMALYFFQLPFEDLAAFGVILLIGLAVNNGIVLMDLAMRLQREQGYSPLRAVTTASMDRVRPILMTYTTTVAGMLPLAFGGDEGSDWKPVAVTVIGGLSSATILTLFVLPAIYMSGEAMMQGSKRRFEWLRSFSFSKLKFKAKQTLSDEKLIRLSKETTLPLQQGVVVIEGIANPNRIQLVSGITKQFIPTIDLSTAVSLKAKPKQIVQSISLNKFKLNSLLKKTMGKPERKEWLAWFKGISKQRIDQLSADDLLLLQAVILLHLSSPIAVVQTSNEPDSILITRLNEILGSKTLLLIS